MPGKKKNLSDFGDKQPVEASWMQIGIAVAEWNHEITDALLEGALSVLKQHGVAEENIRIEAVPGSFELPQAASMMVDGLDLDAVICIGCIIQGETRHFEFIAQAAAKGCMDVSVNSAVPVIFGVLTTDTYEQALDRAGGKHGNKGDEAAMTAIHMADLRRRLSAE